MDFSFLFEDKAEITMQLLLMAWWIFLLLFIGLLVVKLVFKFLFNKTSKDHTLRREFFNVFARISWYSCLVIPLFFGLLFLPFKSEARIVFALLFIVAIVLEIWAFAKYILMVVMEKWFKNQDAKTKKNLTEIINTILQILIWILAVLIVFDTIWIAITPFIASLGVWWIAVAFASQRLLEDFFSSFSIMWSSPFRIWDWIAVSGYEGTVKKIGLRTTTLQTLEGATVIIPNRSVVSDVIENSWTIKTRRKRFSLSITYETPVEKYKKIPKIVEEIINKQEAVEYEWALLKDLQDSYVEVLVSYIVKNDDKIFALKAHDKILLEILEVFAKEGIDFAYPTQTLYTKK